MPLFASLLSLIALLAACAPAGDDYGFKVSSVELKPGYQKISTAYRQQLSLSREAVRALDNGVTLTIRVDMELRDSMNLTLLADDSRLYTISYHPLMEQYGLSGPDPADDRTFPRLRHVMNELSDLEFDFNTGPLAPGKYEFRTRIRLDNARLPAPMHLPALFSADWHHDSEWSTWPFEINV